MTRRIYIYISRSCRRDRLPTTSCRKDKKGEDNGTRHRMYLPSAVAGTTAIKLRKYYLPFFTSRIQYLHEDKSERIDRYTNC